jgi:hypothetical protein
MAYQDEFTNPERRPLSLRDRAAQAGGVNYGRPPPNTIPRNNLGLRARAQQAPQPLGPIQPRTLAPEPNQNLLGRAATAPKPTGPAVPRPLLSPLQVRANAAPKPTGGPQALGSNLGAIDDAVYANRVGPRQTGFPSPTALGPRASEGFFKDALHNAGSEAGLTTGLAYDVLAAPQIAQGRDDAIAGLKAKAGLADASFPQGIPAPQGSEGAAPRSLNELTAPVGIKQGSVLGELTKGVKAGGQAFADMLSGQPLRPELKALAPQPNYGYGQRPDGTNKGRGFLGEIKRPDGNVMTEYSVGVNIGGKEMDIPTIVPTLTPDEINQLKHLKDGEFPSDSIIGKAKAFAEQRLAEGRPVFAQAGDEINAQPLSPATPDKATYIDGQAYFVPKSLAETVNRPRSAYDQQFNDNIAKLYDEGRLPEYLGVNQGQANQSQAEDPNYTFFKNADNEQYRAQLLARAQLNNSVIGESSSERYDPRTGRLIETAYSQDSFTPTLETLQRPDAGEAQYKQAQLGLQQQELGLKERELGETARQFDAGLKSKKGKYNAISRGEGQDPYVYDESTGEQAPSQLKEVYNRRTQNAFAILNDSSASDEQISLARAWLKAQGLTK